MAAKQPARICPAMAQTRPVQMRNLEVCLVKLLPLSFSRKPADPCALNEDEAAFEIGTVLVESSGFLPRNRFPEWRVIHRYADQYATPHVVLQNVNEPGSRKSLSMPGLVASGKYLLKEPRRLHS